MRVFEVSLEKVRTKDMTTIRWPDWWEEVKELVNVVAYENHPGKLGQQQEGALCVATDDVADAIFARNDPAVKKLTVAVANTKGRKWRPQVADENGPGRQFDVWNIATKRGDIAR